MSNKPCFYYNGGKFVLSYLLVFMIDAEIQFFEFFNVVSHVAEEDLNEKYGGVVPYFVIDAYIDNRYGVVVKHVVETHRHYAYGQLSPL